MSNTKTEKDELGGLPEHLSQWMYDDNPRFNGHPIEDTDRMRLILEPEPKDYLKTF